MGTTPLSPSRIGWLDTAKGLGILAVVFGHLEKHGEITRWIYSFHMPLFFFLAGIVQKQAAEGGRFRDFLAKKARSRLLLYLVFSAISLAAFLGFRLAAYLRAAPFEEWLSFPGALVSVALGRPGFNEALWFLVCLFFTEIYAFPFLRLSKGAVLAAAAAVFLLLCTPWASPEGRPLFLMTGTAATALPFLLMGFGARDFLDGLFCRGGWLPGAACAVFLVLSVVLGRGRPPVDMCRGVYGGFPGFFLDALCGIAAVVFAAELLRHAGWLRAVGRASAVIFGLHLALKPGISLPVKYLLGSPLQGPDTSLPYAILCTVLLVSGLLGADRLWQRVCPRRLPVEAERRVANIQKT